MFKFLQDPVLLVDRRPEVSDERLILQHHHIHILVQRFLLGKKHFINIDCRYPVTARFASVVICIVIEVVELVFHGVTSLKQHIPGVDYRLAHSFNLSISCIWMWQIEALAIKTIANPEYLFSDGRTGPVHYYVYAPRGPTSDLLIVLVVLHE